MIIPSCDGDVKETTADLFLFIVSEFVLFIVFEWHILPIIIGIALTILVLLGFCNEYIYFSRTIHINKEGCRFVLGHINYFYSWDALTVRYCDNLGFRIGALETYRGPGLIIATKQVCPPKNITALTYCMLKHPFSSVFLRFSRSDLKAKCLYSKRVYQGYEIDRIWITELLKDKLEGQRDGSVVPTDES